MRTLTTLILVISLALSLLACTAGGGREDTRMYSPTGKWGNPYK